MSDSLTYDDRTKLLHWLSAAAIVTLWLLGQTIDEFPQPMRIWVRSAHIVLGVALVVITILRLHWRFTGGRQLPPPAQGLMLTAAKAGKHLIYLLLPIALLLGLGFEAIRADNILGLGRLPSIAPDDRALRHLIGGWHALAANGLIILAAGHAAAGLYHHFILRDGVLRRMLGRAG